MKDNRALSICRLRHIIKLHFNLREEKKTYLSFFADDEAKYFYLGKKLQEINVLYFVKLGIIGYFFLNHADFCPKRDKQVSNFLSSLIFLSD